MTGYVRNDTSNNIADGNVVNAADFDGEFDAIESAFVAATGHTHDGTAAEGGAITVTGPAQDYVSGAGDFSPKTDSTYTLGTTGVRWSTGYLDNLVLTTALPVTEGGTGSTSASAARASLGVAIGSDVQAWSAVLDGTTASFTTADETKLDGIEALADVTDTTNVTAAGALMDSEVTSLSGIKTLVVPASTTISTYGATLVDDADAATARTTLGLGTLSTQNSGTVSITGGSITGITDLAVADGGTGSSTAAGALVNLGLTATAAELNTLDGITATVTELNYTDGVTSNIQTQLDAKAPDNELTQLEVEDDTSTVFGQVSGERLGQAGVVSFTAQEQQIGVGQTWQLVTRSVNVWYQNTTGKPIGVFGRGSISSPVVWDVGPSTTDFIVIDMSDGDSGDSADYGWIIVPVDHYYRNTATWNSARELR